MLGRINNSKTLGGLLIALAFTAFAATPAHAGLTDVSLSPAKTETTIDWSAQAISYSSVTGASTSSIDTHSLFASESTTTSSATIDAIPTTTSTPAEAPMPPAVVSGSVMLILGGIAARVMKRKLAL